MEEILVQGTKETEVLAEAFGWRWKGGSAADEEEWERSKAAWTLLVRDLTATINNMLTV
jgi:hypothetical protein